MNNLIAISWLKTLRDEALVNTYLYELYPDELEEALNMAIKALTKGSEVNARNN